MATKETVAKIIARMSAAFPNWNTDKFTVQVYFEDLNHIPDDLLETASNYCRTEPGRKFAPSTGEIIGACMELAGRIENVPSPAEAWREASDPDGKGKPWSHPLVKKAAEAAGGWHYLCNCDEDKISSNRARFLQFYESYCIREKKDTFMRHDVKQYIEDNQHKLLEDRQSAFDTGEDNEINQQIKQLTRGMTK